MTYSKKRLARGLFDCGAVRFGRFELKHNESDPLAEKSPIKFELRTPDHPKGGPLTEVVVSLIGQELYKAVPKGWEYEHIAGIPDAGDPLTSAFNRARAEAIGFTTSQLRLGRKKHGSFRRVGKVIFGEFDEGDSAVVIDDVVTYGQSKAETLAELELQGIRVAGFAVVIDREQGGRRILERQGYEFVAVFTIGELMEFYVAEGNITPDQAEEVMSYVARNQAP